MPRTEEVPFPPMPHLPMPRVGAPFVRFEPRWEYRVLDREGPDPPAEAELNAMGDDGWELIGVVPIGARVHFYFKRERAG